MPVNDLEELFKNIRLDLPYIETDDKRSFSYHYRQRMQFYLNELHSIPEKVLNGFNKKQFISLSSNIVEEILQVLDLYFNGFPSQAYIRFKNLVESPQLIMRLTNWRTISLDTNTTLYRTKREFNYRCDSSRSNPNGFVKHVAPLSLFHVPFERRKAIGTNRFSIPGFPCIYLSGSLHTSWSEAMTDKKQSFHAACFRNHRPVYIVDLIPLKFTIPVSGTIDYLGTLYNHNDFSDALQDYAIIFPLVAACHTKIIYTEEYIGEVKFKSEYIIPQLLLQWYRDKHILVDGIRYLSCTAEARFPHSVFDKFNYVIPVLDLKEEGYCNSLLHNYSATDVYSQLEPTSLTELDMLDKITQEFVSQKYVPLPIT